MRPIELSELKYTLVCVVAHVLLSTLLRFIYGDRRSTVGTMGGSRGNQNSMVREVLAYNAVTTAYQAYCAYVGTTAWFDGTAALIGGSPQQRLYGDSAAFEKLAGPHMVHSIPHRAPS